MIQLSYTTSRLNCRPLNKLDYPAFADGVIQDKDIQKYFRMGKSYGEVCDFLEELPNTDCIPVGLFKKSTNQLIGYINGYVFGKDTLTEALDAYTLQCINKCGVKNFRFEVDADNFKSISALKKFHARHVVEEDYDNDGRKFLMYIMQF